jgi:biopolymer transport protein ExbB
MLETTMQFITAGGFVMYPLLLLSFVAGVIVIERLLVFRELGHLAPGLLPRTIALCKEKKPDQALRECRDRKGPLAAALGQVLEHVGEDSRKVERCIEESGQEYFIRLEKFLSILDTATTISPLLGLLGTIVGMIRAFNAISAQAAGGNNDIVLHGVAEALYATACGISIAILCFIAYNYFTARLRHIMAETEMAATKLMNVLSDCEQMPAAARQGE